MKILNSEQMRRLDSRAIRKMRIPAIVLMENAGLRSTDVLVESTPDLDDCSILVLCGRGNNGGDGLVVARHLACRGLTPRVVLAGRKKQLTGEAAANLRAAEGIGLEVEEAATAEAWRRVARRLGSHDLIVDALLGTGLRGPARGLIGRIIESVNRSGVPVFSIDIPSGLSGDSDQIPGPAIRAERTVTFCRPKMPHLLPPADALVGDLTVVDIGIPDHAVEAEEIALDLVEKEMLAELLTGRDDRAHKGDFGHVLVVAGSRGRSGAAALLARAALRGGCGLVTVATSASAQPIVASQMAELMTLALPETKGGALSDRALDPLLDAASACDLVVVGPGLGTEASTRKLVRSLVERSECPVIVDADGLNAYADNPRGLSGRTRPLVLTPHPGEMARLAGLSTTEVLADRVGLARAFARRHRCHLVLKGYRTIIATPDGRAFVNPTGNPGMATAGSGDALGGFLGAFMAQTGDPLAACLLAVWLHGRAGDIAAGRVGEEPLIAGDLIERFPEALRELTEQPE